MNEHIILPNPSDTSLKDSKKKNIWKHLDE